jgi:exodeoxyribonuclease-3
MQKFVSWNVNGLRACLQKGFSDFFEKSAADIFALQEIKLQKDQVDFEPEGYYSYWNFAERKGYSGTAIFSKRKPVNVTYGMGVFEHEAEGRLITLEFDDFYFSTVYAPNSQEGLKRLGYRMEWENSFRFYVNKLKESKPVIFCGDLNVAHKEIDLKNPASNRKNAGFTDEEREKLTELLESGFTDSFRYLYPDKTGAYTWWSYMFNARANNAGWRIDYFLVSKDIEDKIRDAVIYQDVMGSDHCPIGLEIDL